MHQHTHIIYREHKPVGLVHYAMILASGVWSEVCLQQNHRQKGRGKIDRNWAVKRHNRSILEPLLSHKWQSFRDRPFLVGTPPATGALPKTTWPQH